MSSPAQTDQTAAARPRIQAVDLASSDDPYPHYTALREQGPVVRGEFGQWLIVRHEAVSALLRDPRLASHFPPDFIRLTLGHGPASTFPGRIVLTADPPSHTAVRRFVGKALGTPVIRAMTGSVQALVDQMLTPAMDSGRLDIAAELAVPLPVAVICRLIGVPDEDRDHVVPRVIDLAKVFDAANLGPGELDEVNEAVVWLRQYIADLLLSASPVPNGNLAQMYAAEPAAERIEIDEIVDNLLFLFHAGFETTMGLISNGCAALLAYPDQMALLRKDPSLVRTAVDEFLRFDSPIQNAIRVAREPIEIGGIKIRTGRSVMLLLGAANRDPAAFERAGELDITRSPNPHVGFGGGLHHCLGTALARLMGELVFQTLAVRFTAIEHDGTATRRRHGSLRSFEHLPLSVSR
ncbi:cytochrome P450 [Catelliglobosispora koreensis]|uniref:cytochrome P450 n=1 Tax=Catelliglobosispora koreensis TaxID=129052 RepID=UPI00037CFFE0|nr:cytochrome P450 [Catelliglobosispora koreensis]